jgi:general secretion pathway protein A
MYKSFYNLKRNPFELSPDPAFLFPSRRHNEALAALYYGVRRHKGIVVITGEAGTGKTLLVRCLLQLLENSNVDCAYAFNSRLSPIEFLEYVVGDLGLTPLKSKSELLLQLSNHLVARHRKKLTTVLVVDEAHDLSREVLEEIRLLTNLETPQEKLLQVLLIGQPELDEKLDSYELRQLKQRIALRSRLEAFDEEETRGYIHRRLQLAGANSEETSLFPIGTIARVYDHSLMPNRQDF